MYNCVCSRLKEVNGFYDYDEYTRFCHIIEGFVTNKLLVEVPVEVVSDICTHLLLSDCG